VPPRAIRRGDQVVLKVAYDGREFAGWQLQPGTVTVQGALEAALARLHGVEGSERVALVGAGRTDSGVHALGQIAAYRAPGGRGVEELELGLDALLPPSVRVLSVSVAPPAFHPCRSATGKLYRYRIVNRRTVLPFESPWAWHVRAPLDLGRMRRAAARLEGRRDFASVATGGGQSETTVRHLRRLEPRTEKGGTVIVDAEADGFLYRMVRNLVGLLVEVGHGRREPDDVTRVLDARDRSAAGRTAPPHGLCLVRVDYGGEDPFRADPADLEALGGGW
jgi:tRNA pseudouridine38-40 synthase